MSNQFLVTDTHPLIWYLGKQEKKLPKKVLTAFRSAQDGSSGTHIWVPAAAAWEISILMRKTKRISGLASFEELIRQEFYCKNMSLTEVQPEDLIIAHALNFNNDPFDGLIAATAKRMELPLITADSAITDSRVCKIFW